MHAIGELFAAAYTTVLLWDEFWKTVIVFFKTPFLSILLVTDIFPSTY